MTKVNILGEDDPSRGPGLRRLRNYSHWQLQEFMEENELDIFSNETSSLDSENSTIEEKDESIS